MIRSRRARQHGVAVSYIFVDKRSLDVSSNGRGKAKGSGVVGAIEAFLRWSAKRLLITYYDIIFTQYNLVGFSFRLDQYQINFRLLQKSPYPLTILLIPVVPLSISHKKNNQRNSKVFCSFFISLLTQGNVQAYNAGDRIHLMLYETASSTVHMASQSNIFW